MGSSNLTVLPWQTYKVTNQSIVRCVTHGNDGRVYAGASNEFGYLEVEASGKMHYHSLLSLVPKAYQNFDEIWKVYQTNFGIVFQSYKYLFIYRNNSIKVITPPVKFDFSFYINDIYYLVDKDKGIFILKEGKLIPLVNCPEFADNEIRFILPIHVNELLIGTINRGTFIYNGHSILPWKNKINDLLISNRLFTGIKLKKVNLLLVPFRMVYSYPMKTEISFNMLIA